ncbi:hypothetical protein J6590_006208 [Homalodisca vitripennis]|nr:hypothetical protein J6590_006208 [Homalodisca vitripennis]
MLRSEKGCFNQSDTRQPLLAVSHPTLAASVTAMWRLGEGVTVTPQARLRPLSQHLDTSLLQPRGPLICGRRIIDSLLHQ